MALIICPECGKNFSDRAPACPECGCPISVVTGQDGNADEGKLLIANNAFQDGRYEEAYQLFAQLYSQQQDNSQILIRLGLATAAKDYFSNGVSASTEELLSKGFMITKNNAKNHDDIVSAVSIIISDVDHVIEHARKMSIKNIDNAINQTTPMRSAGEVLADGLFMPMISSQRNLYEDRKSVESNIRILNNANDSVDAVKKTLNYLKGYVLKLVASIIDKPLDQNHSLYAKLKNYVSTNKDTENLNTIFGGDNANSAVYGLCYGEEKVLLRVEGVTCFLMCNGRAQNGGGFAPPNGTVIITNYKIKYIASKEKHSFVQPLDQLKRVQVGGVMGMGVEFVFPNDKTVSFRIDSPSTYVSKLQEKLQLFI